MNEGNMAVSPAEVKRNVQTAEKSLVIDLTSPYRCKRSTRTFLRSLDIDGADVRGCLRISNELHKLKDKIYRRVRAASLATDIEFTLWREVACWLDHPRSSYSLKQRGLADRRTLLAAEAGRARKAEQERRNMRRNPKAPKPSLPPSRITPLAIVATVHDPLTAASDRKPKIKTRRPSPASRPIGASPSYSPAGRRAYLKRLI
jgi:hypothetical protein